MKICDKTQICYLLFNYLFYQKKKVYLIPYQGSTLSTSEGILKVFEKANKYQETSRKEFPVASVVLLDEGTL